MTAGQVSGELMGQLGLERTSGQRIIAANCGKSTLTPGATLKCTYRESLFTQDSSAPEPDFSQSETASNS